MHVARACSMARCYHHAPSLMNGEPAHRQRTPEQRPNASVCAHWCTLDSAEVEAAARRGQHERQSHFSATGLDGSLEELPKSTLVLPSRRLFAYEEPDVRIGDHAPEAACRIVRASCIRWRRSGSRSTSKHERGEVSSTENFINPVWSE